MTATMDAIRNVNTLLNLLVDCLDVLSGVKLVEVYFYKLDIATDIDYITYIEPAAITELGYTISHIDRITEFIYSADFLVLESEEKDLDYWFKFFKRTRAALARDIMRANIIRESTHEV